jgi:dTDP-4-dehydrorhamnose reductase
MKKIFITGSQGMLGEAIQKIFKDYDLILTDKEEFDVRKETKLLLNPPPDYIFHLAAETDLEYCETIPSHAYYTNTIGTMNMVEIAKFFNIPIVYISTAGVFSGEKEFYTEEDIPCPINHYGRSKYYGELAVQTHSKYYIFRQGWSFGGGTKDKKFVMKIINQLIIGKKTIYAVTDKFGSPTYTHHTAKVIREYLETNKPYGIYHISTGRANRKDVASFIIKDAGAPCEIIPVKSSFYVNYPCPRPKNEVLVSVKNVPSQDWKEGLKEYLNEIAVNQFKSPSREFSMYFPYWSGLYSNRT